MQLHHFPLVGRLHVHYTLFKICCPQGRGTLRQTSLLVSELQPHICQIRYKKTNSGTVTLSSLRQQSYWSVSNWLKSRIENTSSSSCKLYLDDFSFFFGSSLAHLEPKLQLSEVWEMMVRQIIIVMVVVGRKAL